MVIFAIIGQYAFHQSSIIGQLFILAFYSMPGVMQTPEFGDHDQEILFSHSVVDRIGTCWTYIMCQWLFWAKDTVSNIALELCEIIDQLLKP